MLCVCINETKIVVFNEKYNSWHDDIHNGIGNAMMWKLPIAIGKCTEV